MMKESRNALSRAYVHALHAVYRCRQEHGEHFSGRYAQAPQSSTPMPAQRPQRGGGRSRITRSATSVASRASRGRVVASIRAWCTSSQLLVF